MLMQSCGTTPPTSTGTDWCDVMNALGGQIGLSHSDVLTPETHRHILAINQHGMDTCGWGATGRG